MLLYLFITYIILGCAEKRASSPLSRIDKSTNHYYIDQRTLNIQVNKTSSCVNKQEASCINNQSKSVGAKD